MHIIWHYRNISLNMNSVFYADWCSCGIIYLKVLLDRRTFLSVKYLTLLLETRKNIQEDIMHVFIECEQNNFVLILSNML